MVCRKWTSKSKLLQAMLFRVEGLGLGLREWKMKGKTTWKMKWEIGAGVMYGTWRSLANFL